MKVDEFGGGEEGGGESKIKTEGQPEVSMVPVRDADPLEHSGSSLGSEFMDPSSPGDVAPLCKTRRKFCVNQGKKVKKKERKRV